MAAFACASEFPDSIRRMFVTREYNPRGLYKVRIFDPIKKKFVIIVVDDRIPCKKGTKKPRFMSRKFILICYYHYHTHISSYFIHLFLYIVE